MCEKFPNLFSPLEIRGHVYRNRILTGPTLFAEFIFNPEYKEGTYRMVEERARGGAASVTTGELTLDDNNVISWFKTNVDIDQREGKEFEGFKEYSARIKKYGAISMLELCNEGGPTEKYTEERMAAVCDTMKRGAAFAMACGFDGVLLHGGHGFIMQQFVSPLTNQRTDEYGGSAENRARFPMRILKALREGLGENGILEMRFSAEDGLPGGMTIDDTMEFCKLTDGMVDIFHISNGLKYKGNRTYTFTDMYDEHGYNIKYAAKVKSVVTKSKVAVIGGINSPELCEEAIATGKVDLVILSRQAIADPEFPNKAKNGEEKFIRRCLRCCNCYPGFPEHESEIGETVLPVPGEGDGPPPFAPISCFEAPNPLKAMLESISHGLAIGDCTINPETNLRIYPELFGEPDKKYNVLVIGGGPAGMQAAITAAKRGHTVTIAEQSEKIGGILLSMEKDYDKRDLYNFDMVLVSEVKKYGIRVITNCNDAEKMIKSGEYNYVIIAVGGIPRILDVPGYEKTVNVITACLEPHKLGKSTIIVGSGLSGCEASVRLAGENIDVTILARSAKLAPESTGFQRVSMIDEMDKRGVKQLFNTRVKEIYDDGVLAIGADGNEIRLYSDSVVGAGGTVINPVGAELKKLCDEYGIGNALIGDCKDKTGRVIKATLEGYLASMLIGVEY